MLLTLMICSLSSSDLRYSYTAIYRKLSLPGTGVLSRKTDRNNLKHSISKTYDFTTLHKFIIVHKQRVYGYENVLSRIILLPAFLKKNAYISLYISFWDRLNAFDSHIVVFLSSSFININIKLQKIVPSRNM